jgi:nucleoside-diphosphate-sugar epimerase
VRSSIAASGKATRSDSYIAELRAQTEHLLRTRRNHGTALAEFRRVRERGIQDFEQWQLALPPRILVTGGTGCIGTAVLRLLQSSGIRYLTSVSRRPPTPGRVVDGVEYRMADIRDYSAMRSVMESDRPQLVIHLAGQRQPAVAERHVAETVSCNIIGTKSVLDSAGAAGVPRVVTASTGKALRFYAAEVYAATKKLAEYLVGQGCARWGVASSSVRFTHVVDNSVIHDRLLQWARRGDVIKLHASGLAFYAQSAREAAQLLLATAVPDAEWHAPSVAALTDIGWPHGLLDLTLDVIEEEESESSICFAGFEPGYEDQIFPGTFDARQSGHSPLFNLLEMNRLSSVDAGQPFEAVELNQRRHPAIDRAIDELEWACLARERPEAIRDRLHHASVALLKKTFADAPPGDLRTIASMAQHEVSEVPEHLVVHQNLLAAVESARDHVLVT